MVKLASRVGAMVALGVFAVSVAVAAPGDKKASAAPKCSACGMSLTAKKDKTHTKAVKIKGKTYYCCAGCKMK
jgi:hypothetical protein